METKYCKSKIKKKDYTSKKTHEFQKIKNKIKIK